MFKDICIGNKSCELMKAIKGPRYGSKTVLTNSSWEYVDLFLKRHSSAGASDALFYWGQAHSFYLASLSLPDSARPLTSYYCILNSSKALLRFKSVDNQKLNSHGISTVRKISDKTNLNEAKTIVKGAGVLPELGKYFDCQFPLVSVVVVIVGPVADYFINFFKRCAFRNVNFIFHVTVKRFLRSVIPTVCLSGHGLPQFTVFYQLDKLYTCVVYPLIRINQGISCQRNTIILDEMVHGFQNKINFERFA